MNPKQIEVIKAFSDHHPKSVCRCGHTGDGGNSAHLDTLQKGHGPCTDCTCKQFTWQSFTVQMMAKAKHLTETDVEIVLTAEPEVIPVQGNFEMDDGTPGK